MSQNTQITLLVLDVDGVMSDGKVTYTSDGAELKSFNIKDGVGIKRIQKAGVQTAIITGRISPMVERRARTWYPSPYSRRRQAVRAERATRLVIY